MSENGVDLTTSTGRLVWGHPGKPRARKHQDGPQRGQPMLDDQGKPIMEIAFGVAFAKADFQANIWPVMSAEIATGYPQGVPPRFSYKYQDGDGIDSEGKPFNQREGYAGNYVMTFTQRINETFGPPPIYKYNPATGKYDTLAPTDIKCGDYVAVATNMKVNVATGTHTPSIYVNPKAVELVGYGTEIVSAGGVDPNAAFGGQQRALPPGASAVPMQQPGAPSMPGMGAMPGAPQIPAAPTMPGIPSMVGAPAAPVMAPPPPPPPVHAGPQRPTDPSHVHNNGDGTEQWLINGQWDGQRHPVMVTPPPAHDFVAAAGYQQPVAPQMPGMPAPRG